MSGSSTGPTVTCGAGTMSRSSTRATPPSGSRSRPRITTASTRMSAWRTASSTGIFPTAWISLTWPPPPRVNAAALAVRARAPAPPEKVQIEAARLENDTTLRWAPSQDPGLAGYRVVWRETTSAMWEHSLDLGRDVTRTTVKGVSKDDVIFGVEAFDSAGHASPAVFPSARMTL